MGTRHLTILKLGEKVHGQYGQWDGYPSGTGVDVLNFIQKEMEEPVLIENFKKAQFIDDAYVQKEYNRLVRSGVDSHMNQFHRDCSSNVLGIIQQASENEPVKLHNGVDFAADSLFCEWAYMLDLDEKRLRVFRGFNKSKLESDAFFKYLEDAQRIGGDYQPIREIGALSFDEARATSPEDFVRKFEPQEE